MKKILTLTFMALTILSVNAQTYVSDSVTMGAGYANEVYYSLKNGSVKAEPNNNWHLAFRNGMSNDGIFINSTNQVKAYLATKDISKWATIDTNSIGAEIFNTDTSYEVGAYNRTFDNPYCSWGIYNSVTHVVTGDSIFVFKVGSNYKKLWIVSKEAGVWTIRLANINGSNDTTFTIDRNNFKNTIFAYINANTNTVLNREAADSTWDIKFTRYAGLQPVGGYYPSTGVLSNIGVKVAKATGINKVTYEAFQSQTYSSNISTIGADWKFFDMGTNAYAMVDSVAYFIKQKNGDVYKLYFTGFVGASAGKSSFVKAKMYTTGLGSNQALMPQMNVYPNPANDYTTVLIDAPEKMENASVIISDLSGKIMVATSLEPVSFGAVNINTSSLNEGVYIVSFVADGYRVNSKLVINR